MKYLEAKKRAFLSIVNKVKGFIRKVSGASPLILPDCVDEDSLINYTLEGQSYQDGIPIPEEQIEVEFMGDKTENLFKYPYNYTTLTKNGVTFTDNGDGTVTVNGTASSTANANFTLMTLEGEIDNTKKYYISGALDSGAIIMVGIYSGGSWKAERYDSGKGLLLDLSSFDFIVDKLTFNIYVLKNRTANNVTIKPMLVEGDTPKAYEPYNKYKIPVIASGKNYFNANAIKTSSITIKDNGRTIRMPLHTVGNGYESSKSTLKELCPDLKVGDNVKLYFDTNTPNNQFIYLTISKMTWYSNSTKTITQEMLDSTVVLYANKFDAGDTEQKIITNFQIGAEVNKTSWEPYIEPITTNIYLNEPLRKISEYADYIDFENQKLVRNIYARTLDQIWGGTGAASGTITNTYPFYIRYTGMKASYGDDIIQILATGLKGVTYNHFYNTDEECICVHNNSVELRLNREKIGGNTQALATTYLKEHPMTIYYALDTPTETDIVLPKLPTFRGTTIYSIDTKVSPSNMSATYYSSVKGE